MNYVVCKHNIYTHPKAWKLHNRHFSIMCSVRTNVAFLICCPDSFWALILLQLAVGKPAAFSHENSRFIQSSKYDRQQ